MALRWQRERRRRRPAADRFLIDMQQYVARRVLLFIPTLLLVSLISFSVLNLLPGSAVEARLADAPQARAQDIEALKEKLGLNDPVALRYWHWLQGLVQGDLGTSLWSDQPVEDQLFDRLPVTLELGLMAFVLGTATALILGIVAATQQNGWADYLLRFVSVFALSIPSFWIGTLVVVLGAKYLDYLPPLERVPFTENPLGSLEQFLVPSVIIAVGVAGGLMRLVRASMIEVLRQDYVRTAYAKGLRSRAVIYRHVLKNAMIPVTTIIGSLLANIMAGSVIIETIFNLSGMGRLLLESINQRDYPMIQAIGLLFAILLLAMNLAVDLSYALLDPRIKY